MMIMLRSNDVLFRQLKMIQTKQKFFCFFASVITIGITLPVFYGLDVLEEKEGAGEKHVRDQSPGQVNFGHEPQARRLPERPLQRPPKRPFDEYSPTLPTERDYNLSNILNIQGFRTLPVRQSLDNNRIQKEATLHPGSILSYYAAQYTECKSLPSIAALRRSVDKYFTKHYTKEPLPTRDTTLVIHHDPNKLDISFVDTAVSLAKKRFKRVRLLVPDSRFEKRLTGRQLIVHHHNTTDDVIAFMSNSAQVLVHTGEISALGALVAKGTVYHTNVLSEYTTQNAFKWLVRNRVPLSPEKITPYVKSLDYMGPVRPTCCDFQSFGKGDEEKIICRNTRDFSSPCWVLAVGSAGRFGFERDVLSKSECYIHTFDCTGSWKVPQDIADRVTLHKLCLGAKSSGLFRTWEEVIKIGSDALPGATNLTRPSFAKLDIEGFEFPVIQALIDGDDEALPQQIAMEVHKFTPKPVGHPYVRRNPKLRSGMVSERTIGELFWNLSRKGYHLVHRADNPHCPHCSEVTVVRRAALPAE